MDDTNEIHIGGHSQAKQVAAGSNISQTHIETQIINESARPTPDARFSIPTPPASSPGANSKSTP